MKVFFFKMRSSDEEEMSFQVPLGNCQGFSVPDGGGNTVALTYNHV